MRERVLAEQRNTTSFCMRLSHELYYYLPSARKTPVPFCRSTHWRWRPHTSRIRIHRNIHWSIVATRQTVTVARAGSNTLQNNVCKARRMWNCLVAYGLARSVLSVGHSNTYYVYTVYVCRAVCFLRMLRRMPKTASLRSGFVVCRVRASPLGRCAHLIITTYI